MEFNKDNKTVYHIGFRKRKIKERTKEHKGDSCNERDKRTIIKIALNENINVSDNKNYAYCSKGIEIISNSKTCNSMEHFTVYDKWQ